MKKIICFLILLFIPISAKATYGIENYRIDVSVLDNGNLYIQEAFKMNGIYNGFERKINYKNNYTSYYGSILSSTGDASIYNGSGITLNEIRAINFDTTSLFDYFVENGDLFKQEDSASKGDYGVYVIKKDSDGEKYIIYNPNNMNKDFYISYTLENVAVVHNDVGEVELNVFSEMDESINNLEIYIHVDDNNDLLKVWAHGFTEGTEEIIDNKTAKITINNLDSNSLVDFRLVFDKDVLSQSKKYTGLSVLDNIINIEDNLSEEANKEKNEEYNKLKDEAYSAVEEAEKSKERTDYEKASSFVDELNDEDFKYSLQTRLDDLLVKIEKKEYLKKIIYTLINLFWLTGLFIFLVYIYNKKEKVEKFKKCSIDFPSYYDPAIVGFLLKKKIDINDLTASILYLINKKIIKYKEYGENNFKLTRLNYNFSLSESEQKLLKFLFKDSHEITLKELKYIASEDYDYYITAYSNWINQSIKEAENLKFYDDNLFIKIFGIIYSISGLLIGFTLIDKDKFISSIFILILSFLFLFIFLLFNKKTKFGYEEKNKWLLFKNKIVKINENEVECISNDLEKYFIYSISLNCSNKFLKNIIKLTLKDKYINELLSKKRFIKREFNNILKIAYSAKDASNYLNRK